jgi:hypothetical protein
MFLLGKATIHLVKFLLPFASGYLKTILLAIAALALLIWLTH